MVGVGVRLSDEMQPKRKAFAVTGYFVALAGLVMLTFYFSSTPWLAVVAVAVVLLGLGLMLIGEGLKQ
jgi:uncharacterized membrane protein HdeD (DUF308 family)